MEVDMRYRDMLNKYKLMTERYDELKTKLDKLGIRPSDPVEPSWSVDFSPEHEELMRWLKERGYSGALEVAGRR